MGLGLMGSWRLVGEVSPDLSGSRYYDYHYHLFTVIIPNHRVHLVRAARYCCKIHSYYPAPLKLLRKGLGASSTAG
eukprot:scaffold1163_cov289-Chaetoceros_neogracile.AAC.12